MPRPSRQNAWASSGSRMIGPNPAMKLTFIALAPVAGRGGHAVMAEQLRVLAHDLDARIRERCLPDELAAQFFGELRGLIDDQLVDLPSLERRQDRDDLLAHLRRLRTDLDPRDMLDQRPDRIGQLRIQDGDRSFVASEQNVRRLFTANQLLDRLGRLLREAPTLHVDMPLVARLRPAAGLAVTVLL